MTESNGDGDDNLLQLTDTYFRQVVAVNRDYASVVFRSCLSLLPEAETAAFLLSGCIEAFALSNDGEGGADWLNEVITVCPDDFQIVAEAIQRSFGNHDVVYKLVDLYLVVRQSIILCFSSSFVTCKCQFGHAFMPFCFC